MPEGYKEKRAELIASRIYLLNHSNDYTAATTTVAQPEFTPTAVSSPEPIGTNSEPIKTKNERISKPETTTVPANPSDSPTNSDWDDIPF
jgi:single-strand DNA-binding protein